MDSRLIPPTVVVIGGGFGGLEAAKALAESPCSVVLIDRKNHHCFQPLLYQVATASLSATDVAWPIRSLFADAANIRVVMDEVTGIDRDRQRVQCTSGDEYDFDYLVIATGSEATYFGHDDWKPFAPGLKTIEDAIDIRSRILSAFEQAEKYADPALRAAYLTFVVIGGGPTGVEMAGAIAGTARSFLESDFRTIKATDLRIVLIEAGPRLLAPFPENLAQYAEGALRRFKVEVHTGVAVKACDPHGVTLADDRFIASRCIIWAAGVRASPAAQWLDLPPHRAGRVEVDGHLAVPNAPNIFAIGDVAAVRGTAGVVPQIAPAAKQMGGYVGRLIRAKVRGDVSLMQPFAYRHEGDLATIGRASAVVRRGRLQLTGFIAWLFWGVVHIYFLVSHRSRIFVSLNWLLEYFTQSRGSRIISLHEDQSRPAAPS